MSHQGKFNHRLYQGRRERAESGNDKVRCKEDGEEAESDIMLLEQRPALRPALNTLLTVLCTSLKLNYSAPA